VPVVTIFGGPNGAGKSSVIGRVDFVGRNRLLEADAIARQTQASTSGLAAIAAGREVLRRTRACLELGLDFAIETTLSGNWIVSAVQGRFGSAIFCPVSVHLP
jgi:predicted ABC-type ATPase